MEKIICFHNPNEENGYMSNWYLSDFKVNNIYFTSMEQYMMYIKAIAFNDTEIARKILLTQDVAYIKQLGRQVKNFDEKVWARKRLQLVKLGLIEKFKCNLELNIMIQNTENAILAECAVKDKIWGIGISMKNQNRLNRAKWVGLNLLGYALMDVRKLLG